MGRHRRRRPNPLHPMVFRLYGIWLRSAHPSMYDAKVIRERDES